MSDFVTHQDIVQFLRREFSGSGKSVKWYWPRGKKQKALEREKMGMLAAISYENNQQIMSDFVKDLRIGTDEGSVVIKVTGKNALAWGEIIAGHLQAIDTKAHRKLKLGSIYAKD